MQPALVVIDMQNKFLGPELRHSPPAREAIEIIVEVASWFRRAGRPVIWVQDHESCEPGDPAFEVIEELAPEPGDPRVHKVASNAFKRPELGEVLARTKSDFALICGFKAEGCVLATVKGAEDRDVAHAVLRDAIVSPDPAAVKWVESISPIASWQVVQALLGAG